LTRPFLFRTTPSKYETISSYIQKVAESNFIMPSDIWRVFSKKVYRYQQNCISVKLDVNPSEVFDVQKFEQALFLDNGAIESMSLLSKINDKLPLSQRNRLNCTTLLNKFFITSRRYCPICLRGKDEYKLIWQIQGVNYCSIHQTRLEDTCYICSKRIFFMGRYSRVGFCPSCETKLNSKSSYSYFPDKKEMLLHEIWNYILDNDSSGLKVIDDLSNSETIAIKLLYLLKRSNYRSDKTRLINLIRKKSYTSELEFQYILNLLLKTNTNFTELIALDVPSAFINNIDNRDIHPVSERDIMTFLALWP
jgi:uncharacterized Zn finger protein (UPF0148 family)